MNGLYFLPSHDHVTGIGYEEYFYFDLWYLRVFLPGGSVAIDCKSLWTENVYYTYYNLSENSLYLYFYM
jgi:hypothetical protein